MLRRQTVWYRCLGAMLSAKFKVSSYQRFSSLHVFTGFPRNVLTPMDPALVMNHSSYLGDLDFLVYVTSLELHCFRLPL